MVVPGRKCAYEFGNLRDDSGQPGTKETVEWRQHGDSFEKDEVENWARFVVWFMEWTRDAPEPEFWRFLFAEIGRQDEAYHLQLKGKAPISCDYERFETQDFLWIDQIADMLRLTNIANHWHNR